MRTHPHVLTSQIVILSLDGGGCGSVRTPILTCADALRGIGRSVDIVRVGSDQEIDAALDSDALLVVAAAADGELRAVLRRLVKRLAAGGRQRSPNLADDRTIPDLPPMGVLPMSGDGLLGQLGVLGAPGSPGELVAAIAGGAVGAYDLLRTDAGSVTLGGAWFGGDEPWRARIEVDDAVLSDGDEQLAMCRIENVGDTMPAIDAPPLISRADPTDGALDVTVMVPTVRRRQHAWEVRRARGRAVAVTPLAEVSYIDDGVTATLSRKRSWWVERGAWHFVTRQGTMGNADRPIGGTGGGVTR